VVPAQNRKVCHIVGGVVSPLLANVYLHYVFDLWVEAWRKKAAVGDVIVVRYADNVVLGFQYRTDAERFLRDFRERLVTFGLELHPERMRLIEFERFAFRDRKRRGEGKPETFVFLGSPRERLAPLMDRWIPPPRILHPHPGERFNATHP
jgi:Reverse transcriptase (RNA-dependent DNA polymerase)